MTQNISDNQWKTLQKATTIFGLAGFYCSLASLSTKMASIRSRLFCGGLALQIVPMTFTYLDHCRSKERLYTYFQDKNVEMKEYVESASKNIDNLVQNAVEEISALSKKKI